MRAAGAGYTVARDDGRLWRVTAFQPGRTGQLSVAIRRRGPAPAALDAGVPLTRDEAITLVLRGRYLGAPGCLDEGRVGGRRTVFADVSVAGAPKRVRVDLPMVMTWSATPRASAERLADRPVNPRVGTAP